MKKIVLRSFEVFLSFAGGSSGAFGSTGIEASRALARIERVAPWLRADGDDASAGDADIARHRPRRGDSGDPPSPHAWARC